MTIVHLKTPGGTFGVDSSELELDGCEADPMERVVWHGFGFQSAGEVNGVRQFESESPPPPDSLFKEKL